MFHTVPDGLDATVERISNVNNLGIVTPGVTYRSNVNPIGFTGGVYYDFKNIGPFRLGADLRGTELTSKRGAISTSDGAGVHMYSGLGGLRLVFHTPLAPLHPYVEGAVGIGRSDYGLGYAMANNLEYHGFAGLDVRVSSFLEFRVVELGIGGLQPVGSHPGTNSGAVPLESVSAGIVFRFPSQP